MSRLIDADAFVRFLKDTVKKQEYENLKIDRFLTVADVIYAVVSDLEGTSLDGFKNAPTIEPEPKWIPCKERLPKQGQEVICQCRANIIMILKLDADGDWFQDVDHCYMSGFVIAWMPLPESYSGE